MTSTAKIFVVVNLVFAIVAFGSAATLLGAQNNYKEALEQQVEKFENRVAELQDSLDSAEERADEQTQKASEALGDLTNTRTRLEELRKDLSNAQAIQASLAAKHDAKWEEVGEMTTAFNDLRSDLEKASRTAREADERMRAAVRAQEEEIATRVQLEQRLAQLTSQLNEQGATLAEVRKGLRDKNFWLDKYRERFGDITKGAQGQPGEVRGVQEDFVAITVGSKDGVRVGDVYQIRRGGKHVTRITITRVNDDLSIGTIDHAMDSRDPAVGPPQVGDSAEPVNY